MLELAESLIDLPTCAVCGGELAKVLVGQRFYKDDFRVCCTRNLAHVQPPDVPTGHSAVIIPDKGGSRWHNETRIKAWCKRYLTASVVETTNADGGKITHTTYSINGAAELRQKRAGRKAAKRAMDDLCHRVAEERPTEPPAVACCTPEHPETASESSPAPVASCAILERPVRWMRHRGKWFQVPVV